MSTEKPNILWITYEDTSPQFLGCYGCKTPVTPFMDRIAAEGIRFNHAYATAPVCSASRTCIITGCCTESLGMGNHRSKFPIPADIKGFPRYLADNGYYTTNNVKTDYNIENEQDFIREAWHESSAKAGWWNRPAADQPFFSVFNLMDSHQSRTMTKPWRWYEKFVLGELTEEEQIRPEDIELPPFYRDTPEMRRHTSRVHNSLRLTDKRIQERYTMLEKEGLLDNTLVFIFADHGEGIPRGKCNAIGFGYRAPLIIRVPEKWKDLSPWAPGSVVDEPVSFIDLAPTVLSAAGVKPPKHMSGRAFLGGAREVSSGYVFASRNRLDDTPDLCRSVMDGRFVYTRNYHPHFPVMKYQKYNDVADIAKEIRKDYKAGLLDLVQGEIVFPERPLEYLYDINADPWEVVNLVDSPEYEADLERLRQQLDRHIRGSFDVHFLPEGELAARCGGLTPCELRKDKRVNPLPDLMAAAALVDTAGRHLPEQIGLLQHPEPAVRYWAAVGLYAARGHLQSSDSVQHVAHALAGQELYVQIELAAALYANTRDTAAFEILKKAMEKGTDYESHQALQKILYMPEQAPDFLDIVRPLNARFKGIDSAPGTQYPVHMSTEMFMYLYGEKDLFYPDDEAYL